MGECFVYELKLRLADKNIAATVSYESTVRFCREYISEFTSADAVISVEPEDIISERAMAERQADMDGTNSDFSDAYLETLALYRKIALELINHGVILFHGSAVALDGECYLFTAKSGTGKSTHTRLWRETFGERAVMVNDDKPLIALSDGGAIVYGTPWCGKHRLGNNISAPLKALCILERAEENVITDLSRRAAFPEIFAQTYRAPNPMFMQKTMHLLDKLLNIVPAYRLGCNMEKDAPIVSYNKMKGNKNEA